MVSSKHQLAGTWTEEYWPDFCPQSGGLSRSAQGRDSGQPQPQLRCSGAAGERGEVTPSQTGAFRGSHTVASLDHKALNIYEHRQKLSCLLLGLLF